MRAPLLPLQGAIYQRLSTLLSCPTYDAVPQDATMPYVVIGETIMAPASSKTRHGSEVVTTFHVWSQTPGFAEVKGLIDEILQALEADLTVTGFDSVFCQLDGARTLLDPDGVTRHGVVEMRFFLQEV
jgi:hypothetical protein